MLLHMVFSTVKDNQALVVSFVLCCSLCCVIVGLGYAVRILTPYEQYYIHSLHKEGKLISEQSLGDPNPLILLAIDSSQPLT